MWKVAVGGWLEFEELVKPARSRTGLLGDERAPVTQHSADLDGHERFVPVDNEVEHRVAEGEPAAGFAGRLIGVVDRAFVPYDCDAERSKSSGGDRDVRGPALGGNRPERITG
jgi:hypothetical protein